jgi:organic radical activating enzyme
MKKNKPGALPLAVVVNERYGLATNSSSTHSIIFSPEITSIRDSDIDPEGFGWEFFTLASKEEKTNYMMAQILGNVGSSGYDFLKLFLEEYSPDQIEKLENLYIDHDSVMSFPTEVPVSGEHGSMNMGFAMDYKNFIVNNNFVILGGNDNTSDNHELADSGIDVASYHHEFNSSYKAWKNGNYWVLRKEGSGHDHKLRVQFNLGTDFKPEPLEPKVPELLDIKITDYCDLGCSFCYQDSTASGQHADVHTIRRIADNFKLYDGQLEVALGGGEPTSHPEFKKILELFHMNNYIVNFTTKSKTWFEDKDIIEHVEGCVKGIAYSVSSPEEAMEFYELHKKHFNKRYSPKIYLHLIPEILTQDAFRATLAEVEKINARIGMYHQRIKVTLLGFKPIGRGENIQHHLVSDIDEIFNSINHTSIGVDTKFAHDYKPFLDAMGIDPKLYTTIEGEYSMYVDAVAMKAYRSSWQLEDEFPILKRRSGLLDQNTPEIFQKIRRLSLGAEEPQEEETVE